jgi:hypothetical protein
MALPRTYEELMRVLNPAQSDWEFVTSSGVDVSIDTPVVNVGGSFSHGQIYIKKKGETTERCLTYTGIGAGVGYRPIPIPFNISGSVREMISSGSIFKTSLAGQTLHFHEFQGYCAFIQLGYQSWMGRCVTLMYTGANRMICNAMGPAWVSGVMGFSRAILVITGDTANLVPGEVGANILIGSCQ